MVTTALVRFNRVKQALAEAVSIDEVKAVRDKAEALRLYSIQQRDSLVMQNDIAEIKIRAERRIGELLKELERAQGTRTDLTSVHLEPKLTFRHQIEEAGISKRNAIDWQAVADLPEETFEQHIATEKTNSKELTSAGVLKLVKKLRRERDRASNHRNGQPPGLYKVEDGTIIIGDACDMDLSAFPDKYGVIIADPPWAYRVARKRGVAEEYYTVMTDEDIAAMPIAELACDDCVLLLWATWPKLPVALAVMDAWRFDYVTGLPWVKTTSQSQNKGKAGEVILNYGVGFWLRGNSEMVLFGRCGKPKKPQLESFMGILSPNFQHSRKPDSVHEIAETLDGPYLELFARRSRPGWTVFGNEIQGVLA